MNECVEVQYLKKRILRTTKDVNVSRKRIRRVGEEEEEENLKEVTEGMARLFKRKFKLGYAKNFLDDVTPGRVLLGQQIRHLCR